MDLANTVAEPRSGATGDLLSTPADLARWLGREEPWLGTAPAEAALRLADFRNLRQAIRLLFAAAIASDPMPADAVRAVNAASAAMPTHPEIDASDPRAPIVAEIVGAGSRTAEMLARIARSAVEIIGGPDRQRLRVCGASGCGTFYLLSRPGQVWCSRSCGNRARVARHHARRKDARGSA